MTQLKFFAVRSEFIEQFTPRVVCSFLIEQLPMLLNLRAGTNRHQLQRP